MEVKTHDRQLQVDVKKIKFSLLKPPAGALHRRIRSDQPLIVPKIATQDNQSEGSAHSAGCGSDLDSSGPDQKHKKAKFQ